MLPRHLAAAVLDFNMFLLVNENCIYNQGYGQNIDGQFNVKNKIYYFMYNDLYIIVKFLLCKPLLKQSLINYQSFQSKQQTNILHIRNYVFKWQKDINFKLCWIFSLFCVMIKVILSFPWQDMEPYFHRHIFAHYHNLYQLFLCNKSVISFERV